METVIFVAIAFVAGAVSGYMFRNKITDKVEEVKAAVDPADPAK